VVIIDDEIDIVSTLSEYLELKDIQIIGTGKNGQDAIDLCVKHSPDFLILDLTMPDFDGFYALEKLREMNSLIKVIVMTGLLDKNNQQKLSQYRLVGSFTKPTNLDDLVNCIKK